MWDLSRAVSFVLILVEGFSVQVVVGLVLLISFPPREEGQSSGEVAVGTPLVAVSGHEVAEEDGLVWAWGELWVLFAMNSEKKVAEEDEQEKLLGLVWVLV